MMEHVSATLVDENTLSVDGVLFVRKSDDEVLLQRWQEMNASLQEAIADLWPRAAFTMHKENRDSWVKLLRELGVEVPDA